jgi:hypothetical protein
MSLPLITAQAIEVGCFHCDKNTLEMHSNVAGTGKAGAKVAGVSEPVTVKSVLAVQNALGKGSGFPAETVDGSSRVPIVRFAEET